MFLHDTIAAIATPPGESGIGIIRISGPEAKAIACQILRTGRGRPVAEIPDHQIRHGLVFDPGTQHPVDEVLYFYAARPRSFTAEDTVEIHCHGGGYIVKKVLEILLRRGARLAEPGEFTQRAFLNGRIDLVQAESIIDLIRAKSAAAHGLALNQLTGRASRQIDAIEGRLYQMLVAIEAVLDFPEEGIPETGRADLLAQANEIEGQLDEMYAAIDCNRKIRDGFSVVIAGRPNVGKSSLFNAFLQEERAIVTEIPGTTRDILEAELQLQGVLYRIADTAGLRVTDHPVERIGISKAEQLLEEADLILFVLDGGAALTEDDRRIAARLSGRRFIAVINKLDLPRRLDLDLLADFHPVEVIEISVKQEIGMDRLLAVLTGLVARGELELDDRITLSSPRHKAALASAGDALRSFSDGLQSGRTEDLLAIDLRSCLHAIGEITGKNVSEEVIKGIFANFCIGK